MVFECLYYSIDGMLCNTIFTVVMTISAHIVLRPQKILPVFVIPVQIGLYILFLVYVTSDCFASVTSNQYWWWFIIYCYFQQLGVVSNHPEHTSNTLTTTQKLECYCWSYFELLFCIGHYT